MFYISEQEKPLEKPSPLQRTPTLTSPNPNQQQPEQQPEQNQEQQPEDQNQEEDQYGDDQGDDSESETGIDSQDESSIKLLDIVRSYKLKIIYSRLIAISRLLDFYNNPKYKDLKKKVVESIEFFHILGNNYSYYNGSMETIIQSFEKFLKIATKELKDLTPIK